MSENVRPSAVQWQLLHSEKDDQVIRHNNNKTLETKEKSIRKAFLFKTLVNNCSAEIFLFCFAGSVLFSLLCVYYFGTIFVIHQKNWLRYHPLMLNAPEKTLHMQVTNLWILNLIFV
jgi:hypothetical protein